MNVRVQVWLWLAQRISGGALALFVSVHLLTMIVAVQGGLSAAEITARLHSSAPWLGFYSLFVVAAGSLTVMIGLIHVIGVYGAAVMMKM